MDITVMEGNLTLGISVMEEISHMRYQSCRGTVLEDISHVEDGEKQSLEISPMFRIHHWGYWSWRNLSWGYQSGRESVMEGISYGGNQSWRESVMEGMSYGGNQS